MKPTFALEADRIGRRHADQWLLREVSFSVNAGQRIALVGNSGSGKTLLLRSLAMLDPLDTGEVRFNGASLSGNSIPAFRRQVIYLHQRILPGDGTVESFLREPFSLAVYRDEEWSRADSVRRLDLLGRGESFLDKQLRDLSGGESQIAALLRAVQLHPKVLLLDEPTAAMDEETVSRVEQLIDAWFDENSPDGRALVWVTHHREQASRVADRIVRIECGEIVGGEIQAETP